MGQRGMIGRERRAVKGVSTRAKIEGVSTTEGAANEGRERQPENELLLMIVVTKANRWQMATAQHQQKLPRRKAKMCTHLYKNKLIKFHTHRAHTTHTHPFYILSTHT